MSSEIKKMKQAVILLFDDYETLDAFGPIEILGRLEDYEVVPVSLSGGKVRSAQGIEVDTKKADEIAEPELILVPGGMGTRREVVHEEMIERLRGLGEKAHYVLTVCTGSAVLAKTGLLDGMRATSNKMVFEWVTMQNTKVQWIHKARWVNDGKYYTSSGISAGLDMALGFVADRYGIEKARQISHSIEYHWQEDSSQDDFCLSV